MVALIIFWLSLILLIYTFAGYPVLIAILAKIFPRRKKYLLSSSPLRVSVVLVVYNEERRILSRIENLLNTNYPVEFLELIIVSDGSTDRTNEIVTSLNHPKVRLIQVNERAGKSSGVNLGVQNATGDIIVFCDARQKFNADTIPMLVSHFNDPEVGAVSGSLEIDPASTSVGTGVDLYWRIEKMVRYNESLFDSCIGCTGAVYAIRKELFEPIPTDTILDDVVIPMKIAIKGYRVIFDPNAVAYDPQPLEPEKEKIRKERTLAGNFQMLFRYPQWIFPWNNRLFFQLISHKYMRLTGPVFMCGMFFSNLFLIQKNFYMIIMILQFFFYYLAFLGFVFEESKVRLFSIPAGFVFLNWQVVSGFVYYLKNRNRQTWMTVNESAG